MKIKTITLRLLLVWTAATAWGITPALAEHELVMTTIDSDLQGTNALLQRDYERAIALSEPKTDAAWNIRKLAARTNLCIAYTVIGDFDKAVSWCDAAMEVGRLGWVAKNNRAVLHLLMGEIELGHAMLEAAEDSAHGRVYWLAARKNHTEAEYIEAMAKSSAESESLVVRSGH